MNASLFDRARAERFAQLLDEADGGRRHHARSRLDGELAELVAEVGLLRRIPIRAMPDPDFKRDLRIMLLAAAERSFEEIDEETAPSSRFARPRARGAIVMGIAAGTLALSGVSMASGEAIPGDPLYGMKRSTERAQLALAGSDLTRGQLHLDFARTRLEEAYQVRGDLSSFVDALFEADTDTRLGVHMLVSTAISKHDTTALDAIGAFVTTQRELMVSMVELTNGDARDRLTGSLTLLNAVEQRANAARSALACGAPIHGSDALGPVPGSCGLTAIGHPAVAGQPASTTSRKLVTGIGQVGTTSETDPANAKTEKKDDGLLGELGRILGGLLGG